MTQCIIFIIAFHGGLSITKEKFAYLHERILFFL